MGVGDSRIVVKIIGDAKSLTGALNTADRSIGRTAKNLAVGAVALVGVKEAFDFLGESNKEADRLADATQRVEIQLGDLSGQLIETADDFSKLGQSKQDILEMEAAFADIATATGIADPVIASLADNVAATAAAVALLGDQDPATVVDLIGKAAGGSEKAMKALGVSLTDSEVAARAMADTGKTNAKTLTDQELAAARLELILEQLKPKLDAATTGTGDLEQRQGELGARIETLQAQLGEKLAPALADVLGFINDEIAAIPGAIEGWKMLGAAIENFGRTALGPLGNVRDALEGILDLLGQVAGGIPRSGGFQTKGERDRSIADAQRRENERNGLHTNLGR